MLKNLKKIMIVILLLFVISFIIFAIQELFSEKSIDNINLTITEEKWWEFGSETAETTFHEVHVGDVLYNKKMGKIKVTKVSSKKIVFGVEGSFVEYEEDGINMKAEDLTKIKLHKGESIKIASKSYDAGVVITILFN